MTLPKPSACRTCASRPRLATSARGSSSADEPGRVQRLPAAASGAPSGELRGDRGEQVAAVEARRDGASANGEAPMSTASATPPKRSRGEHQQPVVGPDEQRAPRRRSAARPPAAAEPTPGSTTARCTPAGMYAQRAPQHERARAHLVARDPVRDVDDPHVRRDPRDHPVADADELVLEPVVREERHHGHRRPSLDAQSVHTTIGRRTASGRGVASRIISPPTDAHPRAASPPSRMARRRARLPARRPPRRPPPSETYALRYGPVELGGYRTRLPRAPRRRRRSSRATSCG